MAKRVCTLGLLAALCMVLGYLERLVSLSFIAPGVRLGLANAAALLLIAKGDAKGALGVNITRILLSALLFGNPVSLAFSLSGGIASWCVMRAVSRCKSVSIVGMSIAGGAVHNLFQLFVALMVVGRAVLGFAPLLLLAGAVSGALIGALGRIIFKKMQTNGKF